MSILCMYWKQVFVVIVHLDEYAKQKLTHLKNYVYKQTHLNIFSNIYSRYNRYNRKIF